MYITKFPCFRLYSDFMHYCLFYLLFFMFLGTFHHGSGSWKRSLLCCWSQTRNWRAKVKEAQEETTQKQLHTTTACTASCTSVFSHVHLLITPVFRDYGLLRASFSSGQGLILFIVGPVSTFLMSFTSTYYQGCYHEFVRTGLASKLFIFIYLLHWICKPTFLIRL